MNTGSDNEEFCLVELLDHPDELRELIERRLVGPQLLRLVRELELLQGTSTLPCSLTAELRDRILTGGLCGLSDAEFQSLMRQPRVLLQIQKAVLLEGSAYWDLVIQRSIGTAPEPVSVSPSTAWYRHPWGWTTHALVGLAAAVVVYVSLGGVSRQLSEQMAQNETLRHDLAALRAAPAVVPGDLPEEQRAEPVRVFRDPLDLPGDDPPDLPEMTKPLPRGV
jgi:hypothetical protein